MKVIELDKVYLEKRTDEFIGILKAVPHEYWGREHFLYELKDKWKYSIVAEDKGKVIGYIIASNKIESVHIHKFMVKQEYRSKGIGLLLLKEFELICFEHDVDLITLKVYKDNILAIKFYLKNDFKTINDKAELFFMSKKLHPITERKIL